MEGYKNSNNFFLFLLLSFIFIATFVILIGSPNKKNAKVLKNLNIELVKGYTKDSNNVYLNGKKLEGVEVNSFLILSPNFAKDNKWVYYGDGGMRSLKINNADSKTFEFLGGGYGKDKSRYFCCQTECEVMKGVGSSFEVVGEGLYAKDNFNAYRSCEKLENVEAISFKPIGANYYLDKKAVYFVDQAILKADSNSFVAINDIYGRDKTGIYYGAIKILDADPTTFKPLGDYYSKDKTFVYFQGKVLGSGVDTVSFESLANSFSKDSNYVYYFGKKMIGIDRNSFEVLDIEYERDKNSVYYNGVKLEKADSGSFKALSNFFAKDNFNVFRYGQITSFDASTFLTREDGSYQDKNGAYSDGSRIVK